MARRPRRNTREDREDIITRVKEGTRDAWDSAVDKAQDTWETARDSTEDYIKKKPLTSVAIAAGIGVLIGAAVSMGINSAMHRRRTFWERMSDWF